MQAANTWRLTEIIEDIQGINWRPPHECKMVTSDLVYSPAQVTEHRHMEAEGSKHLRRNKEKV